MEYLQLKLLFKLPTWENENQSSLINENEAQIEDNADRVCALERSTRVALDHLESVPEKLSLLEEFKDFGERKTNMSPPTDRGEGFFPSWKERSRTFEHSSSLSQPSSYVKKMIPLDSISPKEDATNVFTNGIRSQARKEKFDSNKNKMQSSSSH
ncbi:centrosomal protein of 128 kDa-like isoform X2 [Sarcophilus harrisii]|uniref:centrosomal protein of 128 kDa-like isoform X2 n=1 Tax=Sarcophilus harrisii TaxID=9305 RepID=UPI001301C47A|nr:centrosomal protein of 128 kDa-like isoform X2 [Sarcophilus harrisii]